MRVNKLLVVLCYVSFGFMVCALALFRPHLNWDVLGYSAAVKAYETLDANVLHGFAYGELERVAPAETIAKLVPLDTSTYRGAVHADPKAFAEQLTYYRVRVGYVLLVRLLFGLGIDIVTATYLVSALSVYLGILILCAIVLREIHSPFVYVVPLFALIAGTLELAKSSSPDALAFLGVMLASLFFLRGNLLVFAVLPMLITVRVDLVLFCIPLLVYLAIDPKWRLVSVSSAFALLGVYAWLGAVYGHPRWASIVYACNFGGTPFPLTAPPAASAALYGTMMAKGLYAMTIDRAFLVFAAMIWFAVFGIPILKRAPGERIYVPRDKVEALFYASAFYCGSHFLLLPLLWERYFTTHYLLAEVALLAMWSRRVETIDQKNM